MKIGRGPRNTTGRPVSVVEHEAVALAKDMRVRLNQLAEREVPMPMEAVENALACDQELNETITRFLSTRQMGALLFADIKVAMDSALDRLFNEGRFPITWSRQWFTVFVGEGSDPNHVLISVVSTQDLRNA